MFTYPGHLTSVIQTAGRSGRRLPSWTSPEAKNSGLILFKNVLFTVSTPSFSFFSGTLCVWPRCVPSLQTQRPTNKSLAFICSQTPQTPFEFADTHRHPNMSGPVCGSRLRLALTARPESRSLTWVGIHEKIYLFYQIPSPTWFRGGTCLHSEDVDCCMSPVEV